MEFYTEAMEKQVGARIQIILDDPQLLKVYEHFGAKFFRRSSIFHGLDRMLRDNEVHGGTCFEIGTWNGLTALILSRYFKRVVTCDIVDNVEKYALFELLGVKNIECHLISDNEQKAALAKKTRFDFAYLDGDHAHDTDSDFAITKHCGAVLMHEAWPWQDPVWSLIHRLPADHVRHGGTGLALWRRPKV